VTIGILQVPRREITILKNPSTFLLPLQADTCSVISNEAQDGEKTNMLTEH